MELNFYGSIYTIQWRKYTTNIVDIPIKSATIYIEVYIDELIDVSRKFFFAK